MGKRAVTMPSVGTLRDGSVFSRHILASNIAPLLCIVARSQAFTQTKGTPQRTRFRSSSRACPTKRSRPELDEARPGIGRPGIFSRRIGALLLRKCGASTGTDLTRPLFDTAISDLVRARGSHPQRRQTSGLAGRSVDQV